MQVLNDQIFLPVLYGMAGVILLVVSFIIIHVRNQNILLKQKAAFKEVELAHQKTLLHAIIQSQETEQRRIGRDLHDDVGTALSRLRMNMERAAAETQMDAVQLQLYAGSKQIIDKVMMDVRNISHQLSPTVLNLYGFTEALYDLASIINQAGQLTLSISNEAEGLLSQLDPTASLSLYRVIQELLANTQKHSRATQVVLSFVPTGSLLQMHYFDNGQGMPAAAKPHRGMGLQNIESRLGMIQADYTIESSEGKGFHMKIQLVPGNEPAP